MPKYDLITKYDSPNFTRSALSLLRFGRKRTIDAITIHHWGVRGQAFFGVVNYLCRKGGNTSAHEVIESGKVAVIVDHKNAAWHAGNAKGNATTIGLELRPEATDGDYATAAQRIYDLRKEYGNLPLIPHRDWKATSCPGNWDLKRLDREARAIGTGDVAPVASVKPKPVASKPVAKPAAKTYRSLKKGMAGADVGKLQQALRSKGYTKQIVDRHFGDQTRANVLDWQKRKGLYRDGIAGKITQKSLGL